MQALPQYYRTNGQQTRTCRSSRPLWATGDLGRSRESERASWPNPSHRLDWDLLAIWIFVAISFTALFFAGYLILAKCQGI